MILLSVEKKYSVKILLLSVVLLYLHSCKVSDTPSGSITPPDIVTPTSSSFIDEEVIQDASQTIDPDTPICPATIEEKVIYYTSIAFFEEDTPREQNIRWDQDIITVSLENIPDEGTAKIISLLKEIESLQNTISFEIISPNHKNPADIEMLYEYYETTSITHSHFNLPSNADLFRGYTYTNRLDNRIVNAKIWFNAIIEIPTSTLIHEFIHSLGLGHSSYQSSVLYTPSIVGELSNCDKELLQAVYSDDFTYGMTVSEFQEKMLGVLE